MHTLKKLLSIGIHTSLFIHPESIMIVFMNTIIVSPQKTSTLMVIYYFKKYPESILLINYMHNYIPCELDVKYTPFCDTKILTYEVELLPSGKKIGFLFIG